MRFFKSLIALLLLITVPLFLAYPAIPAFYVSNQTGFLSQMLTYNDWIDLFDGAQSGEIAEQEVPNFSLVLAYLAKEGVLQGEDPTDLYARHRSLSRRRSVLPRRFPRIPSQVNLFAT